MNVSVGHIDQIYPLIMSKQMYSVCIKRLNDHIYDIVHSTDINFAEKFKGRLVYLYDLLDVPRLGLGSRIVMCDKQTIKEVSSHHLVGQRIIL